PSGRDADHVHAARPVAAQDRGRCRARLLLRRVVAPGLHGARVRRLPDRPVQGRQGRDRQGARAGARRMVDRRVPRGDAHPRRAHATVPARRGAPRAGAGRRHDPDRDRRRVPGDAEGPLVARPGSSGRDDPVRGPDPRDRGGVPPEPVAPDAAGRGGAVRRGPDDLVRSGLAGGEGRDAIAGGAGRAHLAPHLGRVPPGGSPRPAEGLGVTVPRTGGERRRTTIVEEAIRQFGREGYAGASLESIAQAVGVRKQTLLYYFPTKDDLLEACLAAAGARVAEESASALEGTATPQEAAQRWG